MGVCVGYFTGFLDVGGWKGVSLSAYFYGGCIVVVNYLFCIVYLVLCCFEILLWVNVFLELVLRLGIDMLWVSK